LSKSCLSINGRLLKVVFLFAKFLKIWDTVKNTFLELDNQLAEFEYEGTTATVVYIVRNNGKRIIHVANVGDSAAYILRNGEAVKLTKNHRVTDPEETERLKQAGVELNDKQQRIVGLSVSRALGDYFTKTQNLGIIPEPYVYAPIEILPTDTTLVVASDGLWDVLSGPKALSMAFESQTASAAAEQLVQTALQSAKCTDNVTVIVIFL